jgi:hypothetical protein
MNITKGELIKLSTNDINNYIIIVSEVFKNYIICKKLYSMMPYLPRGIFYNYKNEMNILKDDMSIIYNINKKVKIEKNKFNYIDDIYDASILKIYKKQIQLII